MTGYAETYRRSLAEPEEFWAEAAEAIDWERRWDRVYDDRSPTPTPASGKKGDPQKRSCEHATHKRTPTRVN